MSKKRGQLSLEEEKFIRDNVGSLTVEQIAQQLNRHTNPVTRYIDENNLYRVGEVEELQTLRRKLHGKAFWPEIRLQFDEDSGEIEYFEKTWCSLIRQFRDDVLPAEELQIKQFITLDILANRSMKERKRHIHEVEKLQKQIDEEYAKPEDQRDAPKLSNLEAQVSMARNTTSNYTNEYTKILDQQKAISKDLKATREQRIKRIEEGKSSWAGLIAMLEDEDLREKEGREMEILKLSTEKFRGELYQLHQFNDGKLDSPILNAESAVLNEANEQ